MKVFVTSDTHFYHGKVIPFSKRPFKNAEEMNRVMIEKWNKKVSKNDLVFHLGDFAWASKKKIKQIKDQLNGTIILILGNHDWKNVYKKLGFIVAGKKVKVGNLVLTHHPIEVKNGLINVHGHIHQRRSYKGINACVDVTNFEPVPIETYFKKAKKNVRRE